MATDFCAGRWPPWQLGRPLAVRSGTRAGLLPNVPTMIESGYLNFEVGSWVGILAPAGTSTSIAGKLHGEINAGLESTDVKSLLAKIGAETTPRSPQEF